MPQGQTHSGPGRQEEARAHIIDGREVKVRFADVRHLGQGSFHGHHRVWWRHWALSAVNAAAAAAGIHPSLQAGTGNLCCAVRPPAVALGLGSLARSRPIATSASRAASAKRLQLARSNKVPTTVLVQ